MPCPRTAFRGEGAGLGTFRLSRQGMDRTATPEILASLHWQHILFPMLGGSFLALEQSAAGLQSPSRLQDVSECGTRLHFALWPVCRKWARDQHVGCLSPELRGCGCRSQCCGAQIKQQRPRAQPSVRRFTTREQIASSREPRRRRSDSRRSSGRLRI